MAPPDPTVLEDPLDEDFPTPLTGVETPPDDAEPFVEPEEGPKDDPVSNEPEE